MSKIDKEYIFEQCMTQISKIVYNYLSTLYESSSTIKWIDYNEENVEKYKADDNMLCHARTNDDTYGWMVVKGTKLVGYCGCENNTIIALEVMPKFRKHGWATKFIKKAKAQGCTELSVQKGNKPALSLYFKNGFYIYKSNDKYLFMKLHKKKTKIKKTDE